MTERRPPGLRAQIPISVSRASSSNRIVDFVAIGAGTAGLVASRTAAGLGASVVLIERDRTGGDCLWTGCVPSKSLIAAAELAHRIRNAATVGLAPREPEVDFARVMEHVVAAQRAIEPEDSPAALRRDGVEVRQGAARFAGPGRIDVDGGTIRYRTALIATGSRPVLPPIDGLAQADPLTNESIFELRERPGRLVVLGGGPIGCELGQAFARLGSSVSLVEQAPQLLIKEEPEARELVAGHLRADGVSVHLGSRAVRVEAAEGIHRLVLDSDVRIPFDRILVAAGRRPQTEGLGLESVGVELDDAGGVVVDERLATSARNVYAAGDVVNALPFTHVAGYHGRTVAANALFRARTRVNYDAVPWVTFTDPEVGRIGLTEAQARERWGERTIAVTHDYRANDRAITAGEAYGFAKLVADRRGRLVGATVAAPRGGESVAELATSIAAGRKLADVSRTVHAYPTFSEGQARAADRYLTDRYLSERVRRATRPALWLLRRIDRAG
ncbi:MAG: FAD-dependent oxidoreductase [Thermoleophilaceae bacterium]